MMIHYVHDDPILHVQLTNMQLYTDEMIITCLVTHIQILGFKIFIYILYTKQFPIKREIYLLSFSQNNIRKQHFHS